MEPFRAKLGPLPVWAWGALVTAGAAAYFWWHGRASSGADQSAADQSAADAAATGDQLGALGYWDGSSGVGGSTSGGSSTGGTGTGNVPNGSNDPGNCRIVKDPSGTLRHVCGFGHWYRKVKNGHWFWTPGPIPKSGAAPAWHYRAGPGLSAGVPAPLRNAAQMGSGTTNQQAHAA